MSDQAGKSRQRLPSWAWIKWWLTGPNMILLNLRGVDGPSRRVILERWLRQEPKG